MFKHSSKTKAVLLDKAERLFMEKGVRGTSIRELSKAAGVNVAAVNYHFGSKEGLVKAVIARRLRPINDARLKKLSAIKTQYQKSGHRPTVREVVKAFVGPAFEYLGKGNTQARYFLAFIARIMADPDPHVRKLFFEEMKEVAALFWEVLKLSLPHLSEEKLYWRLQFLLGAMMKSLPWPGRADLLPPGISFEKISEIDILEEFITFVTAGLEAESVS